MLTFEDPLLVARRNRLDEQLAPVLETTPLLVYAGDPIPLPENTDQTYPFRAHTEYFYLTTLECPGAVVLFDPTSKGSARWRSFVPPLTEGARIWEGRTAVPGEPLAHLETWLETHGQGSVYLGARPSPFPHDQIPNDARTARIREIFKHTRRPKDAHEIDLLRKAAACTAAGYQAAVARLDRSSTPLTERSLQITLETAFYEAGATRTGYGTIVGSGPNSAVLHFDPSHRIISPGEFVLIDAGAEVDRYVSDVTRTYVAGNRPTPFQRDLHQLVLQVEMSTIQRCRPGTEWKELHLRSAVELTQGLVHLGLMRGNAESLVEQEAHLLFYPHGLGHLVGLGVRDASGTLPNHTKDNRPALRNLRTDLPLQPGYVITVEPGLYFIPALLNDPVRRERYRESVNWDKIEPLLSLGGVRIEDNILITNDEPEILTSAIPKTL